MISVSDEIKLRAEVAATLAACDGVRKMTTAIEFSDMIVDAAIEKSLNIEKSK